MLVSFSLFVAAFDTFAYIANTFCRRYWTGVCLFSYTSVSDYFFSAQCNGCFDSWSIWKTLHDRSLSDVNSPELAFVRSLSHFHAQNGNGAVMNVETKQLNWLFWNAQLRFALILDISKCHIFRFFLRFWFALHERVKSFSIFVLSTYILKTHSSSVETVSTDPYPYHTIIWAIQKEFKKKFLAYSLPCVYVSAKTMFWFNTWIAW